MVDIESFDKDYEYWVFIKDYDNYMVSNLGNVFSVKGNRNLKPRINNCGYYMVNLCENGIKKTITIHRLVGLHFLKNPENKKCIDHINGNIKDNTINNLRWCSYTENSYNVKIRKDNTTGIKGIIFDKKSNKYRVRITINKKCKHIGYYNSLEEATNARKKVANEIFKEFTNICEKIN
jgi:hypothetical protein